MDPDRPTFLARESFVRRRLGDAVRFMPIVGLVLFLMPILWAGSGSTAGGLVFLFSVWGLLIVVIALLSRQLLHSENDDDKQDQSDGFD